MLPIAYCCSYIPTSADLAIQALFSEKERLLGNEYSDMHNRVSINVMTCSLAISLIFSLKILYSPMFRARRSALPLLTAHANIWYMFYVQG